MVGKLYFGSATPFSESSSSPPPRPTSTNAETKATGGNADKTKVSVPAQHVRFGPPITSVASSSSSSSSECKSNNSATTPAPGSSNRSATKADPLSSAPRLEASDHARFAQLGSSNESNVTSAANSRDPVKATTTTTTTTANTNAGNAFIKPGKAVGGGSRAVAAAAAATATAAATIGSIISKEKPSSSAAVNAGVDGLAPGATPLQCHEEDDRILSEIETGILDVFSDAYCNKHLMYDVLELILVRLMPELAERGVIDLWEERLS